MCIIKRWCTSMWQKAREAKPCDNSQHWARSGDLHMPATEDRSVVGRSAVDSRLGTHRAHTPAAPGRDPCLSLDKTLRCARLTHAAGGPTRADPPRWPEESEILPSPATADQSTRGGPTFPPGSSGVIERSGCRGRGCRVCCRVVGWPAVGLLGSSGLLQRTGSRAVGGRMIGLVGWLGRQADSLSRAQAFDRASPMDETCPCHQLGCRSAR